MGATNKFEIKDVAGTSTLAYLIDKTSNEDNYVLQKIECVEDIDNGLIKKTFEVENETEVPQEIVFVTLTKSKAILSSGILNEEGLTPLKETTSVAYGNVFNTDSMQSKEFVYSPNMKRRFTIIDTVTMSDVVPSIFMDSVTNEIKGKCELLPMRPYVVIEVGK